MKEDEVLALSEMMVFLADSRVTNNQQRLIKLMCLKDWLDQGGNRLGEMWLNKRINHDDYHALMSFFHSAWNDVNQIIEEDFDIQREKRFGKHCSTYFKED